MFQRSVSLDAIPQEEWHRTVRLAAGITAAHIGRGLTLTAANTYSLAADGGAIHARLWAVEERVNEGSLLGTVQLKFIDALPIKTGETIAVGDTVVGAGSGEVKAAGSANHALNYVVEVRSGFAVVYKL